MAFPKFQTKEVLNKVLNSGEDALNVDLSDSVTVTVDSEFPAAAALSDDSSNPTTTSVGSHLLGYDSSNTNWNRVEVDDAGHLQIDVLSITAGDNNIGNVDIASIAAGDNNIGNVDIVSLPASTNTIEVVGDAAENAAVAGNPVLIGGRYDSSSRTLGNGDVGAVALDADGAVHIADGGNAISVDGTVTANLGTTDNAVLDAIAASLALLDNSIASGNELQVDVVASLPAGDNNIGNVDIVSLPASTNTIEVVGDAAENANAAGNPVLVGGRYDTPGNDNSTQRTLGNADVGALALDPTGAAYVREALGQSGSILVTGITAVTTSVSGTKFVAIQFIEDTVFAEFIIPYENIDYDPNLNFEPIYIDTILVNTEYNYLFDNDRDCMKITMEAWLTCPNWNRVRRFAKN